MFLIEFDEIKNRLVQLDEKIKIASSDMQIANDEFENIKKDYTKLEQIIEDINSSIETKKGTLNETILNIEKFEGQINVIKEQINSAKTMSHILTRELIQLQTKLNNSQKN